MANKKEKPEATGSKPAHPPASDRPVLAASQQDAEMRRLLREAAWSRMFGKAGPKNPFAR
ncbi:MAG TPA: hypothetical protein VFW75_12285 [Acetobacteraceae bacterium]|nr:hypothetical protein [Acetobacteraceae bacterium]